MLLHELEIIKKYLKRMKFHIGIWETQEFQMAEDAIEREIKLKTMDPRKEDNEKCET